jgi:hypothetical protein
MYNKLIYEMPLEVIGFPCVAKILIKIRLILLSSKPILLGIKTAKNKEGGKFWESKFESAISFYLES